MSVAWHDEARRLYGELGNMKEVARRLDRPWSTVYSALTDIDRRRREYKTAWDRGARMDGRYALPCPKCGRRMGSKSAHRPHTPQQCRACWEGGARGRYDQIVEWWAEGLSLREIASRLGWTTNTLGTTMARMRAEGYDLPHRYAMRDGKRVAA